MNILHMKYVSEVAKCGSVNKAAKQLLMNQSNLSRAIKELEAEIGVEIFARSAKGMNITSEGEIFLTRANKILEEIDTMEGMFKNTVPNKKRFSICVPRAGYIAEAFANFSSEFNDASSAEVFYKETNSQNTIKNIIESECKLGIIRYEKRFDKYYKKLLEEKGLSYELVTSFCYMIAASKESPLAKADRLTALKLKDYVEIIHEDPYIPSAVFAQTKREDAKEEAGRRIFVRERASQLELLCRNHNTFMWVSPLPEQLINRYGLAQRKCDDNQQVYKDLIIHRKDYRLSDTDKKFIDELCKVKRKIF